MTTSGSKLVTVCHFRADGVFCDEGVLLYSATALPVSVEGEAVTCPACGGKAAILTERGDDLLTFLETFARPLLRDLVDELFEERNQH